MDSSPVQTNTEQPRISFVVPCLNEAAGLELVVSKLHAQAEAQNLSFKIVIADNGSTDDSLLIAEKLAHKFPTVFSVRESVRGYGAATRAGITAAHGTHVVCLDADGTYTTDDALTCARTLIQNRDAFVIGNRLTSPDAIASMPWSHRIIGTPVISLLLKILFKTKISDPNCGLRGFSKEKFISLGCTTNGMEFASETIARATHSHMEFIEFPISYPSRIGESKLRTVRDGIRHVCTIFATKWRLLGTNR